MIAADSCKAADFPPPPNPDGSISPRLYNSELIAQSFMEDGGSLKDLKHLIRFPVSNQGIRQTIKDAFIPKGYSSDHYQNGGKGEFFPSDTNLVGILGNAWSGLAGTVNGRPTAMLSKDHAASSEGLQIVKISAWYKAPNGGDAHSALDFEMGHPPKPADVVLPADFSATDEFAETVHDMFGQDVL